MSSTVIVGCKLPNGLIIHIGEKNVTLNGYNSTKIVGGHGITEVDKDFWDEWSKSNSDFDPVKAGLIFASGSVKNTEAEAIEKEDNLSGFEQIDPNAKTNGVETATKN